MTFKITDNQHGGLS